MARDDENRRLQFINLQIEKSKLQNSRDFKEITFAITLLAGISALLFNVSDYFNSNVITLSNHFISSIILLVYMAIIIFIALFIFLLLKWYLISTNYENKREKNQAKLIFKNIPRFSIIWIFILIFSILVDFYITDPILSQYEKYAYIVYIVALLGFCSILFLINILLKSISLEKIKNISLEKTKNTLLEKIKSTSFEKTGDVLRYLSHISFILLVIIIVSPVPIYLLMGSYSIEQFSVSNTDNDILTFTVKETGLPFSSNHVTLYKMNANHSNIFQNIDHLIINNTQGAISENKFMTGIKYEGIWYLNLDTLNLSSGTYNLHAEVTYDQSVKYILGKSKKYDDQLFYIAPRNSNFYSNITE